MVESSVKALSEVVVDETEETLIQVLHVDDEAGFLKAAKQILEIQGPFQVEIASSVEEAMEKMKEKTFDVVVSDYQIPEKDGLEFLKMLRDGGSDIPFVLFTGKGREEVAIEALNLGADRYFNKIGHPETVYGQLAHGIHQAVERKRADVELWRSEERLRALFASSPDAIAVIDLHGNITECNQATLDMLGYLSKGEVIGKSGFTLIAKKHRERARGNWKNLMEQGSLKNEIYVALTKDGRELLVELSASVVNDSSGHPMGFIGIIRDITKRKRAEKALKESEAMYRNLFENAKDVTVTFDLKGNITTINKAAVKYGFKRDETLGKNMLTFVPKKYWPRLLKDLAQLARGKPTEGTVEVNTPKGKRIVEYSSIPMIIDDKVVCFQTILEDTTESKKMSEEIKKSEEKFRSMVETTSDWIWEVDEKCVYTYASPKIKNILGYEPKEAIGKTPFDLMPKDEAEKIAKIFGEIAKKKEPFSQLENWNVHKNGTKVLLETSGIPILDEKGSLMGYRGIDRNITERKKMEEELRNSEKRLSILFEFAPDAYYLNDLKGNLVDGNRAAEKLTGYNKNELIGKNFLKLKLLPRRQIPKAAKLLAKNALGKPTGPDEFVLNRKDNSQVPVEIRTFPVKIEGQTLVLGIARDITERKRAEEELEKTLEKVQVLNEKLGAVGKLTRHDVRNKLQVVISNAYLIKQMLTDDHETVKYLGDVESACEQVERILDFAGTYEKLGMEELTYIDVEKSLRGAVMLFPDLRGVKLVNDCHGLTVLADSLLSPLFYNLMDNSLKHGEKVSQIRVYYQEPRKDKLQLVYEDDGVGLPKAEKEKIFMEGYGKDSGYGLYLIRKMCEVYGWSIRETGKQSKGAQFTITIPSMKENGKENYHIL